MTDIDLSETERAESGPDQQAWRQCSDFETACDLTADWLAGKRYYVPGYASAQPATETRPISDELAAINRLGFLTTDSQPGEPVRNGQGQRAYVTGYCTETTAAYLSALLVATDLVSVWYPPGTTGQAQICVSLDEGDEMTHLGMSLDSESVMEEYKRDANERLAGIISESWGLQIFDPVWGRNDVLLPALKAALAAIPPE